MNSDEIETISDLIRSGEDLPKVWLVQNFSNFTINGEDMGSFENPNAKQSRTQISYFGLFQSLI